MNKFLNKRLLEVYLVVGLSVGLALAYWLASIMLKAQVVIQATHFPFEYYFIPILSVLWGAAIVEYVMAKWGWGK